MLGLTITELNRISAMMESIESDEFYGNGYHKLSGGFAEVVMYKFTTNYVVLHLKSGINGEPESIERNEIVLDRNNFMAVIPNK